MEWEKAATSEWDFTDGEWNIEVGGSLDAFGVGMSTRTDNSVSGYWWGTLVTE